ncbi:MAG: hydrolase [Verrucomicrobiota bacterium]
MKNANIFVDVDLTLVDANGKLLEGARDALRLLHDEGCHLFLWSSVGADYCRKVADINGLTDLFEGFSAKPDIIIDDMLATCTTEFIYDVRREESWQTLAARIIDRHID